MSKLYFKSTPKAYFKFIQTIFIIVCFFSLINCQDQTEEDLKSNVVPGIGIGAGTLAVIIGIAVGVVICILGLAFSSPGIFVFIGIVIPVLIFAICIGLPTEDSDDDKKDNNHKNYYVVARWVYFTIMLILFLGLFFPFFLKWKTDVHPQRVNSNRNRDLYDEKYLEDLEKQKKRKYNLENDIFEDERLPLSSKKKKRSNFIKRDNDEEENINNEENLIDNNLDQSGTLPIGRVKKKNEINDNRRKFKGFKRKEN